MEQITVEKDRMDFLTWAIFGDTTNCYKAASRRAYLDMCRTIRFNGANGSVISQKVDSLIEREAKAIIEDGVTQQEQYNNWHLNVCNKIAEEYRKTGIDFNMGQAQKWVNMTMKYLYIIGDVSLDIVFKYPHVPLDNYVFDMAENKLGICRPKMPWSRIDDYNGVYLKYQREIAAAVNEEPLRWELRSWLEEARNKNIGKWTGLDSAQ